MLFAASLAQADPNPHPENHHETRCLACRAPEHQGDMVPGLLPPKWDAADITASRIVNPDAIDLPARPAFKADPGNLTLVVEHGDHHITLLDGDVMEPIARFATRSALQGDLAFSGDGRFVYWASRDGWITQFDLWNLKVVAETRVGILTRNLAISSDSKVVMVANALPHSLVALDGTGLSLIKVIPAVDKRGKTSRVSAVYNASRRNSFVAVMKDLPEIWEIPYDGRPVYKGLVHDYRFKEAIAEPGPLPVRSIVLEAPLDIVFFDPQHDILLGTSPASSKAQVIHMGVGRRIAELDLAGMPHPDAGIAWDGLDEAGKPRRLLALPHLNESLISVIDMKTWKTIKRLPTLGPGFALSSHEDSSYLWADGFSGPDRGAMHVIDKQRLEIVATLRPYPGETALHVGFDRHGKYALVSLPQIEGALIVYDAKSLQAIKRLPMKYPHGLYNVWNATRPPKGIRH